MSDLDHTMRVTNPPNSKPYALSGQIMLSAIVILFFVVVLMVALHLYARWYLLRARRRQLLRRRIRLNHARRTHQQILFYVDNISGTLISSNPANRGLEQAVLNSLPEFVYSSKTHHPKVTDCAVCLSEFQENETGRILPKCNHSFHIECIDMWFLSHSTCPLCRAPVEKFSDSVESNSEVVINLGDPDPSISDPGCSSGSGDGDTGTSSFGERRKGMEFAGGRIDIPIRSELEDEIGLSSPGASQSFRSPPGTRLLSLKRLLSIGKKTPTTPQTTTSCGVSEVAGTSCSGGTLASEIDELERGATELTQGLR